MNRRGLQCRRLWSLDPSGLKFDQAKQNVVIVFQQCAMKTSVGTSWKQHHHLPQEHAASLVSPSSTSFHLSKCYLPPQRTPTHNCDSCNLGIWFDSYGNACVLPKYMQLSTHRFVNHGHWIMFNDRRRLILQGYKSASPTNLMYWTHCFINLCHGATQSWIILAPSWLAGWALVTRSVLKTHGCPRSFLSPRWKVRIEHDICCWYRSLVATWRRSCPNNPNNPTQNHHGRYHHRSPANTPAVVYIALPRSLWRISLRDDAR